MSPDVQQTSWEILEEIAPCTDGIVVALGLPMFVQSGLYDTAGLVADGQILGFAAKQYLPADGLHYEPRWFRAWPAGVHVEIERGGRHFPFGDLLFDCSGVRVGFEICEDAWVASRPGLALARRGADVLLNPQRQPLLVRQARGAAPVRAGGARASSASATPSPTCWGTRPAARSTTATRWSRRAASSWRLVRASPLPTSS